MQLHTFKAPTMADALTQVKSAMGSDAIILHTRTYQISQWMGLKRKEIVEITAGKGMNIGRRPRPGQVVETKEQKSALVSALAGAPGTYSRPGARYPEPARVDAPRVPAGPRSLLDTPAGASAVMLTLTSEVTTLKQMMKDLIVATRHKNSPQIPDELIVYFDQLVSNSVNEELAGEIMRTVQRNVRAEHYCDAAMMRQKIAEQIEKRVPVAGPITRKKTTGPHVLALVGPTGVGKTTTIAKLAANLKLREKRRVGLITLDTYRIAAVDQLRRYAEIIGAPLKVVGSAEELREAIGTMSDLEFVLIDTAGRSPNDRLKLNELKKVLEAAAPDEVHLVLSTTASEECLELAVGQFNEVRVDKVIFTKLDEAPRLGTLLNVIHRVNKSLSYVTTGQDVPDDIEVAQGTRLAQLILGEPL